ncbi:hypothetical protein PTRA_a1913 [Pseudoalteromonas translucida KMM 520]|uniref:Tetratricopeptide repeat protein n=1 Tax=Pseudoalteromonas translucida KMM 520 TaxID=1315283 RepID=A0A0U2X6S3_9GAMM|nr:hypothetical protein [Pseudoalteromonas translucida]ALS33054.1 hypothetical protein PTRA_a1913 [Pseudoalteromonas translucida KMM 520]
MNNKKLNSNFSPREFMKSRRPERFSDSIVKEVGKLDRTLLEYQFNTLNRRNMELAFEDFAKKLCEKVICPNLLEQTGPVAGGDGKVDTQTFPVSEQAKALWYVGVNEASNEERWAFAVSTQEDWKAKCRKDVRKIKSTNRGYVKAFCVTNRYAKSNQRSQLEDELFKETGIDVRILDVSWILDQVFKYGYEQLAIDSLAIDVSWRREVKVGVQDYEKQARLKELELIIRDKVNPSKISPHQLDWLLEIAVTSKELEQPQIECQGLFERAVNAAERFGGSHKQFNAHYQYAWAAYWWFEDFHLFQNHLIKCIELAEKIETSVQWRDVLSLLGVFIGYKRHNQEAENLTTNPLITKIKTAIQELSEHDELPSNSLMCKVHLEMLKLYTINDLDEASDIFADLLHIVEAGEFLVGFPFSDLYELFSEIDGAFGENEQYEELLDYFTEHTSRRDGERKAAQLCLKRGARRMESNQPYQAIKLIGKSLAKLHKNESRKDLYAALNVLAVAYERVGLQWASRANLLLAASLVTDDFWKSGELVAAHTHSYARLAKVELLLGRISYAISFWESALIAESGIEKEVISESERNAFDAFLAQCLANCNPSELSQFTRLPDLLDRLNLYFSRSILLYVLGHTELIEQEYELKVDQDYLDTVKVVRDAEFGATVPKLINCQSRYISLESSVMGCSIKISFPFKSPLVELAESILAAIEALLSTGIVERFIVIEPAMNIEITVDDEDEVSIEHEINGDAGTLLAEVTCSSFSSHKLNTSAQGVIQEWLSEFLLEVFAYIIRVEDLESTFKSMIVEDKALERAVPFGACFVGLQNILGNDAVENIKGLLVKPELENYKFHRAEAWDYNIPKVDQKSKPLGEMKVGKGQPPKDIINEERVSHKNTKVQHLIKPRLWDRAGWRGMGFLFAPDETPHLMLAYENDTSAELIWSDLVLALGCEDKCNRLQISIIRKIDKKNPAHYKVCLFENMEFSSSTMVQVTARIQIMTPLNNHNLDRFLKRYEDVGRYVVGYGVLNKDKGIQPRVGSGTSVVKDNIKLLDAWEVSLNSMESMAISIDDDPMIPDGIDTPPFLEILKHRGA